MGTAVGLGELSAAPGGVRLGLWLCLRLNLDEVPEALRLDPHRVVRQLVAQGKEAHCIDGVDAIVSHLEGRLRPGDVVTVMSNGAFDGLIDKLLRALESRTPS